MRKGLIAVNQKNSSFIHHSAKIFAIIFLLMFSFSGSARAEEKPTSVSDNRLSKESVEPSYKEVILDGKAYSEDLLWQAFSDAAISLHSPVKDWFPEQKLFINPFRPAPYGLYASEVFQKEYPWFYEYLFRTKGLPRFGVINKWAGPIVISTGMPNDLKPFEKGPELSKDDRGHYVPEISYGDIDKNKMKIVKNEIKKMVAELKILLPFPISYLPHAEETVNKYGNVRIVLINKIDDDFEEWDTPYRLISYKTTGLKIRETHGYLERHLFRNQIERMTRTKVLFTPYTDKQVDGYFLADTDNNIGFSVCYVWQGHNDEMLRALIRECMVRSLGLPDAIPMPHNSLLTLWNDKEKWPAHKRKELASELPSITEMDRYMINLLYSDQIKSGMSSYDIFNILN